MQIFKLQTEQVQILVDRIQHHSLHEIETNYKNYEKLLELSAAIQYPYGEALACGYLAQYFYTVYKEEQCFAYLEKAEEIAEGKTFTDVLAICHETRGWYYFSTNNDMAAFSAFYKGLKLTAGMKNKKLYIHFCCHMAELFFENDAYGDAEKFYGRALDALGDIPAKQKDFYNKKIHISLLRLACIEKDLTKAWLYYNTCLCISCEAGRLPLLFQVAEINLFLLEQEHALAKSKAKELIEELQTTKKNAVIPVTVYTNLLEILIALGDELNAHWCKEEIEKRYGNKKYPLTLLQIQKLYLQYANTFDKNKDLAYEAFFRSTQIAEKAERASAAAGFHSRIALYETDKAHSKIAEEKSELLAAVDRDELTGIYNRRYLDKLIACKLLEEEITSIGYVMIDVDYFKEYNDYYGHPKGDSMLQEIASILKQSLPKDAIAARYGGDEFSCLFLNSTKKEMISFTEEVRREISLREILHDSSVFGRVTLSFGIYLEENPKDSDGFTLIQKADQALYEAKKQGRNAFAVYRSEGRTDET